MCREACRVFVQDLAHSLTKTSRQSPLRPLNHIILGQLSRGNGDAVGKVARSSKQSLEAGQIEVDRSCRRVLFPGSIEREPLQANISIDSPSLAYLESLALVNGANKLGPW